MRNGEQNTQLLRTGHNDWVTGVANRWLQVYSNLALKKTCPHKAKINLALLQPIINLLRSYSSFFSPSCAGAQNSYLCSFSMGPVVIIILLPTSVAKGWRCVVVIGIHLVKLLTNKIIMLFLAFTISYFKKINKHGKKWVNKKNTLNAPI